MDKKSVADSRLGSIEWNSSRETWECSVSLSWFRTFDIAIDIADDNNPLLHLGVAHKIVDVIRDPKRPLNSFIADELLDTYNGTWNTGRPVSRKRFCHKIKPDSLTVFSRGNAWIYFTDGGFFQSHAIVINVDKNGVTTDARLAG